MGEAKIRLSQTELELVTNTDWILTKNAILEKVKMFLAELQQQQEQYLNTCIPLLPPALAQVIATGSSPKISKGENYNGLPYLILDHPRSFKQEDIFAIRTMFWWGNFFSITLHLSGIYKKGFEQRVRTCIPVLNESGFYCCVNDDPWEHHFENGNYTPVSELSKTEFEKLVEKRSFIKLAVKIPLQQWDDAGELLLYYFKKIIELLAD